MTRRIEIELTSARDGESWTWRAAGARQPRGVVESKLLPAGCRVGDVLRAEVDLDLDGITIVSVLPPREKSGPADRIEVIGTPKEQAPVTTSLVTKPDRSGQASRGPRDLLSGGRSGARPDRRGGRGGDGDRGGPRTSDRAASRPGERSGRPGTRPDRTGAPRSSEGSSSRPDRSPVDEERRGRTGRGPSQRPPRQGERPPDQARPGTSQGAPRQDGAGGADRRRRPPRFVPGTAHRDAVLAALPAEQRPIADQLVAGGLPAVRRALAAAKERREGPVDTSNQAAIIALAEQMLPAIKEAVWLDRAEAAIASIEHISLRELRATVLGAAPRDEHGRELDRRLREALDQRVTRLRDGWNADMTRALEDGRVLQALRLSGRPPEPSARFPAALVTPLAEAAGAAMTSETPADRWTALLEAAAASPVGRHVKPAGIPTGADEELLKLARQTAGRVPALASLLGMSMPPPPRPLPPPRQVPAPPRGSREAAHADGRAPHQQTAVASEPAPAGADAAEAGDVDAPAAVPASRTEAPAAAPTVAEAPAAAPASRTEAPAAAPTVAEAPAAAPALDVETPAEASASDAGISAVTEAGGAEAPADASGDDAVLPEEGRQTVHQV